MNIQILTSSYPAFRGEAGGTAGLFVQDFALELAGRGHSVVVQPVARKPSYEDMPGVKVIPLPWRGGDQELASLRLRSPGNWLTIAHFFPAAARKARQVASEYAIDRVLCMWLVPSGLFGRYLKARLKIDYDVWALGSDIWRIRKIPLLGPAMLRSITGHARKVFADGYLLGEETAAYSEKGCSFLPSCRSLPKVSPGEQHSKERQLLFVGRYHHNKGPDLLLEAVAALPEETRAKLRISMHGLGPLEATLPEKISQEGLGTTVQMHGPINDQSYAEALQQADYLIIPSRIESIPLVFSDAMQSGTPVLSMPVGDLPRLIKEYDCGICAPDGSAGALAEILRQSIDVTPGHFAAGVARAASVFSVSGSVAAWLAS